MKDINSDSILQRIVVFEHYFENKSVESLVFKYKLKSEDLIIFLMSQDALDMKYSLDELDRQYNIRSKKYSELSTFIIEKIKDLSQNATPEEFAEMIDKTIPRIIELDQLTNNKRFAEITGYEEISDDDEASDQATGYTPFALDFKQPKLLSPEELENTDIEKDDKV